MSTSLTTIIKDLSAGNYRNVLNARLDAFITICEMCIKIKEKGFEPEKFPFLTSPLMEIRVKTQAEGMVSKRTNANVSGGFEYFLTVAAGYGVEISQGTKVMLQQEFASGNMPDISWVLQAETDELIAIAEVTKGLYIPEPVLTKKEIVTNGNKSGSKK